MHPDTSLPSLSFHLPKETTTPLSSLSTNSISAGFPSPAEEHMEDKIDLNKELISSPNCTFFVKVQGSSMENAHIFAGDILIVDRSKKGINGSIVVAILDGEFTVKRLLLQNGGIFLVPENPSYPVVAIKETSQFEIWGVVTYVIHKAK